MGYIKCINWSLNAITMCWRQHLMSTSLVQLNWKVLNLSVSLLITTSEPQNTRLDLTFCYLLVPLLYKWMLHLNFELIVLLQIILFRLSIWLFCLLHLWGCLYPLIHTHSGPVHTCPEIFVSANFFMRIHPASIRVCHIRSVYPEISVYALQSGKFCIRCVFGYMWTLVSVYFCIRWRHSIRTSLFLREIWLILWDVRIRIGYVWTVVYDSYTLRVDADIFVSA